MTVMTKTKTPLEIKRLLENIAQITSAHSASVETDRRKKTCALDSVGEAAALTDMDAKIIRRETKSQRDLSLKKRAGHPDKRKEAGHYSGLNENKRSKTFWQPDAANEIRIARIRFLACHQCWGQNQ